MTYTILNEWQCCPKCDGQGLVSKPSYIPGDQVEWSATITTAHQCNVCDGERIISKQSGLPPSKTKFPTGILTKDSAE